MKHSLSVLFVCMGNICRSPTAHAVFQKKIADSGIEKYIEVDSAGTHSYHAGSMPDARSQATARAKGYSMDNLTARQVKPEDGEAFDYILAMDEQNMSGLKQIISAENIHKCHYFLDFADKISEKNVPDPYYGEGDGFDLVLDMVEQASDGLIKHIMQSNKLVSSK